MTLQRVAVYCGSKSGKAPGYERAARDLGAALAHHGFELIFGATDCGLMGALARAALDAGGRVVGVEVRGESAPAVHGLSEKIIVNTVAQRKATLLARADALVALPGGLGTFDELFDCLALRSLEEHAKPLLVLNVYGFYDPLLFFLDRAVEAGFVSPAGRALLEALPDAAQLMERLRHLEPVSGV